MNIVISGPFGRGSLCDEIVLAGVLRPIRAAKHTVTVLSANAEATEAMHGVEALDLPSPGAFVSSPGTWEAVEKAHLFLLCSAGVISDRGKVPARSWLAQLETVKQIKRTTALVGAGAIAIEDRKEEVRVQRFLHHFADGISVRDEASKAVMLEYGMTPVRISNNGDPVLSLFDFPVVKAAQTAHSFTPPASFAKHPSAPPLVPQAQTSAAPTAPMRAALFFADGIPLRQTFEPAPTLAPSGLAKGLHAVAKSLAERGIGVTVFHDASRQNERLAHLMTEGLAPGTFDFATPANTIAELVAKMRACSFALTDTLHGMLFAAVHGAPVIFLADSDYAGDLLGKLGCADLSVPLSTGDFEVQGVTAAIEAVLGNLVERKSKLLTAVSILARKEAQNGRMIERLVPRRERYTKGPRPEEDEDEGERRRGKKKRVRIEYY